MKKVLRIIAIILSTIFLLSFVVRLFYVKGLVTGYPWSFMAVELFMPPINHIYAGIGVLGVLLGILTINKKSIMMMAFITLVVISLYINVFSLPVMNEVTAPVLFKPVDDSMKQSTQNYRDDTKDVSAKRRGHVTYAPTYMPFEYKLKDVFYDSGIDSVNINVMHDTTLTMTVTNTGNILNKGMTSDSCFHEAQHCKIAGKTSDNQLIYVKLIVLPYSQEGEESYIYEFKKGGTYIRLSYGVMIDYGPSGAAVSAGDPSLKTAISANIHKIIDSFKPIDAMKYETEGAPPFAF